MSMILLISFLILLNVCIILLIGIYQKNTNAVCLSKKHLINKTVLITGGTAGMGLEMAKDLAQRGAKVIVVCPFEKEGIEAVETIIKKSGNKKVVYKFLDLTSFQSIRMLATDILENEERLDILINNAGVIGPNNVLTNDGLNFVFQVNYFGAFLLTILLLPLLKKTGVPKDQSRIINVSSASHALGRVNLDKLDINVFPCETYFNSKLCLVMFSQELANKLQKYNVVIHSADPGAVGTNIFRTANKYIGVFITFLFSIIFKSPWEGAQTALHVVLDESAGEVSGEYYKNCKLARAAQRAHNDKVAKKLFEESVHKVKLSTEELNLCVN